MLTIRMFTTAYNFYVIIVSGYRVCLDYNCLLFTFFCFFTFLFYSHCTFVPLALFFIHYTHYKKVPTYGFVNISVLMRINNSKFSFSMQFISFFLSSKIYTIRTSCYILIDRKDIFVFYCTYF